MSQLSVIGTTVRRLSSSPATCKNRSRRRPRKLTRKHKWVKSSSSPRRPANSSKSKGWTTRQKIPASFPTAPRHHSKLTHQWIQWSKVNQWNSRAQKKKKPSRAKYWSRCLRSTRKTQALKTQSRTRRQSSGTNYQDFLNPQRPQWSKMWAFQIWTWVLRKSEQAILSQPQSHHFLTRMKTFRA